MVGLCKHIWSIVIAGTLCACNSISYLTYDKLEAGNLNFLPEMRRIGIVNNMPHMEPNKYLSKKSADTITYLGNGVITAQSLAQNIASTNYFDQVILQDSTIYDEHRTKGVLTSHEFRQLINDLDVDVLLTVDAVFVDFTVEYFDNFIPMVQAAITPFIRMYIPQRNTFLHTIQLTDTIGWDAGYSMSLERLINESSTFAGETATEHMLPHWKNVERYYYNSGSIETRDGAVFLREDNLEEAHKLWEQAYKASKGKKRMRTAYNMAVCTEREGLYDQALEYLNEAISLAPPNSMEYLQMLVLKTSLEHSIENVTRLQLQMKAIQ
ncbi:MAG: DUF6340 family protein [Bacteroidales bacterium]|nr:DUF6340 family protein [Bacteroidales bacterium]